MSRQAAHTEVIMHWNAATKSILAALACAALVGCGSSSPGTMSVHLVDGPDDAYAHVTLQLRKVEIHGASGWVTLADFTTVAPFVKEVDLLALRNGVKETLVDGKALPEGHYDQMRLLLGPGNTVTLAGTTTPVALKVPSGMQSGVKLNVSFDVAANTTRDVFIDFDAHRSVFVHEAGGSGKYLLRPVVRAVDRLVTGAITGKLTATGGGPIAGATVMAEALEGARPVVLRSAVTGAAGEYVLDLLPAGGSYHVVAQPVVTASAGGVTTTAVYGPKASGAIAITEATATPTYDASFDLVGASFVGSVSGVISPALTSTDQSDTVAVMATFSGTPLVVRTVPAAVTSAGETYRVDNLPAYDGGYTLAVERATVDGAGGTTVAWKQSSAAPVLPAGTTSLAETLDLSAP